MDDSEVAQAGLEQFGFGLETSVEFIRAGENTTFRVDSRRGAWAVRVHRPGYRTLAMVRSEIAWMEALRGAGLSTPIAMRSLTGDVAVAIPTEFGERLVSLLSWEPGDALTESGDLDQWRELGRLMAEVHTHGASWERPDDFVRPAWDAEGMVGRHPHWGDPIELGAWDAATYDLMVAARDQVRERLDAFGKSVDRYGLVHADLSFANVLARPASQPVLIDFDDCGWSWYLWELAVTLAPFDGTAEFVPRRDALVDGYRSRRALPESELEELPTFVMARRLVTLGWVFTHPETEHAVRQREWRIATFPAAARYYLSPS